MKKMPPSLSGLLRTLASAASALCAVHSLSALPEAPSIDRSVVETFNGPGGSDRVFETPRIPPWHTSADGRIGLDIKPHGSHADWYLIVPEKLNSHFIDSAVAPDTLLWRFSANQMEFRTDRTKYFDQIVDDSEGGVISTSRHVTIIDMTHEFDQGDGFVNNPYDDGGMDIYDLVVHTTVEYDYASKRSELRHQFTPVRVKVSNPKTSSAAIAEILVGVEIANAGEPPVAALPNGSIGSQTYMQVNTLLETRFTQDGKLLVGRIGTNSISYYDPSTGNLVGPLYSDVVYAYSANGFLTPDGDPNDSIDDNIDGFDNLIPIATAPYDPRINGTRNAPGDTFYGFAAFPFRDGSGNIIPAGEDIGASYPWIDVEGRTVKLTAIASQLNRNGTRYPNAPYDGSSAPGNEDVGPFQGASIVGLWTQGKIITMDNTLNNTDFTVASTDADHRIVELYEPGVAGLPITDGKIRVGSGRFNGNRPSGDTGNSAFFDSLENRVNYEENLRPLLPRDVVWWVSNGRATAQFAFDDYLNKHSFIVSKMNGALEWVRNTTPNGRVKMTHHDGWDEIAETFSLPVRVANDATALPDRWVIPTNGLMHGPGVRIEPIAHGGVEGKGAWLDSNNGIEYTVAAQPQSVSSSPWYLGVFVDSRVDDSTERTLITFPDATSIRLQGRSALLYIDSNGSTELANIALPGSWSRNEWTHFGFQVHPGGEMVDFYHNGSLAATTTTPGNPIFQLNAGTLTLGQVNGAATEGYRGWYDDFTVFAQMMDPESAANHARGTLVMFDAGDPAAAALEAQADLYVDGGTGISAGEATIEDFLYHAGQVDPLDLPNKRFAVHYHYATEAGAAHLGNIPAGAESIREKILFPESPLFHDSHRPDSTQNTFCFVCHDSGNPWDAMTGSALTLDSGTDALNDARRQPVQALRRVFGNIPAGWIEETGLPASSIVTGNAGVLADPLVLSPENALLRLANTFSLLDSGNNIVDRIESGSAIDPAVGNKLRVNLDAGQGSVRFRIFEAGTATVARTIDVNELPYEFAVPTDLPNSYDIEAMPWSDDNGSGDSGIEQIITNVTFGAGTGNPTVPNAASGLVATTVSTTEIDLAWVDNSGNEDGFDVRRRLVGGTFDVIATLAPNATSFSDSGLSPDTTYEYSIQAFNAVGDAPFSNTASTSTDPVPTVPNAASGLVATTVSTEGIDLAWVDNSGNEDGFDVRRRLVGGTFDVIATLGVDATSFSDSGLSPDTTYEYSIQAFNAVGDAIDSNIGSATTDPVLTPPNAASDLVATTVSTTEIDLVWVDNSDNEDEFRVFRRPLGGQFDLIATLAPNVTSFSDSGLSPDTTYEYAIRAHNAEGGNAPLSNLASATTDPVGGGGMTVVVPTQGFESGIGSYWNDGGTDCIPYTGTDHSPAGSGSINLRDNSNTSIMTTNDLALAGATQVQVDFSYKAVGFNGREDFWLQVSTDGGSNYVTVAEWIRGTDFLDDEVKSVSVTIPGSYTDTTRIRFRCDATKDDDNVYLDEITISADL